ncbi:MAG: hypothetical protein IJ688_10940 [Treponema sp.]|nr:hypothetical protein [Treponema sp.]
MKYFRRSLVSFLVVGWYFTACNSGFNEKIGDIKEADNDARKVATDFIMNNYNWISVTSGRNAIEDDDVRKMMDSIKMYDEDTEIEFSFSELDYQKQYKLFEAYQQYEIDCLTETLEEDENLLQIMNIDNIAMEDALSTINRSVVLKQSEALCTAYYLNKRNELANKLNKDFSRSSSSGNNKKEENTIKASDINATTAMYLKDNYKRGRILVCNDPSSSSSSTGLGHAAIMVKEFWQKNGTYDGYSQCSISAWPDDGKTAWWDNKIDGVQYEPLAYWAGKASSSANRVYVRQMKYKTMRVKWNGIIPNIKVISIDASDSDGNKAAAYAISKLGKHYNAMLNAPLSVASAGMAKYYTGTFYCSQLVWHSWLSVGVKYDVCGLSPVVFPEHFRNSAYTRSVIDYQNK